MKNNSKELIAKTMDDASFWNVHDELKGKTLDELKAYQKAVTLPYAVCVLNLTGDLNVGMIARTACVFGAKETIIFGRRKYDKRSTVGAQNYMTVSRVDGFRDGSDDELDVLKFKAMMKEKNYFPIFVEQGGRDIEMLDYMQWIDALANDKEPDPCLVLGNENEGIPAEFLELGVTISISQRGVLRSLNVSAAAAIAIHYFHNIMWRIDHDRKTIFNKKKR